MEKDNKKAGRHRALRLKKKQRATKLEILLSRNLTEVPPGRTCKIRAILRQWQYSDFGNSNIGKIALFRGYQV